MISDNASITSRLSTASETFRLTSCAIHAFFEISWRTSISHAFLCVINFKKRSLANLARIIVVTSFAAINAAFALIFCVGIVSLAALRDASGHSWNKRGIDVKNISLRAFGTSSGVVTTLAIVKTGLTLPFICGIHWEVSWLTF